MDGSAFRHLSLGWLAPVLILAAVGLIALAIGGGLGLAYIVNHLHWVR